MLPVSKFAYSWLCSSTSSERMATLPNKRARNAYDDVIHSDHEVPPANLNKDHQYFLLYSISGCTVYPSHPSLHHFIHHSITSCTHHSITSSTHPSITSSTHHSITSSTHQSITSSTHQSITSSTHQSITSSTHQSITSSTHQSITSSTHQSITSSTTPFIRFQHNFKLVTEHLMQEPLKWLPLMLAIDG